MTRVKGKDDVVLHFTLDVTFFQAWWAYENPLKYVPTWASRTRRRERSVDILSSLQLGLFSVYLQNEGVAFQVVEGDAGGFF